MKRLIVFGCSNTYGEGLPDCRGRPGGRASILGWPNQLATLMGISTVINFGIGGASNKHISDSLLNKAGADFFNPDTDVVVFLWSYFCRHCIFQDNRTIERYLPSDLGRDLFSSMSTADKFAMMLSKDPISAIWTDGHKKVKKWYSSYHTRFDQQLSNYTRISHTQHYLNGKGITNYNFTCETHEYTNIPTWFDSNTLKIIDVDTISTQYGKADDNQHPGIIANTHTAKIMYKHITNGDFQ
tara:strand:- start:712 stop:1434 length:723 start_codon:yes stop_codon:yes gene_type:complete